ncbi:2'-5' RNA ligase family protein [Treponema zioleckii]|uniref:2'-5' RNA ligase family protein n=1 Tax=Treponema zioleckii TaxID=331680 RepID=UPI00168ABF0B|nr:2'-5' RNA ligase family protein [Treponema zioleckii]
MSELQKTRTYAVSLLFDEDSAKKILTLQNEAAAITQNDSLVKDAPPPHITLGMFHAADSDLQTLRTAFLDFSKNISQQFSISFSDFDSFLKKVIFLSLKDSESLKELNLILHEKYFKDFKAGANRNYTPERFFPHVAIALKLKPEQFEKGIKWACPACRQVGLSALPLSLHSTQAWNAFGGATIPHAVLPASAKIFSAVLAQCKPYKILESVSFPSKIWTSPQRHKNMAAIKSTGGKLEVTLRATLFKFGFRFRKNDKRLSGSPDIVFPHYRAVIFINGCFWHSHGWKSESSVIKSTLLDEDVLYSLQCEKFRMPTTNIDFWVRKFSRNRERDIRDIEKLLLEGWRVGIVWECSITGKSRNEKILSIAEKISCWLEEEKSELFREF